MTLAAPDERFIEPFREQSGRQGNWYEMPDDVREQFLQRVRSDLALAQGRKTKLNKAITRWRKVLDLDAKERLPYPGAPDLTLPLTRTKRDGIVAHLHDALDVEPFFSAVGYTEEAMEIAPAYEALMERELMLSGGREQYLMAIREAVDVGTGILGWSIAYNVNGEPVVQETLTRLENFFAYPVAVDDLTNCSTFRRYKEPWFILKRMADDGLINPEIVDLMKDSGGDGPTMAQEETRDNTKDGYFSEEQEMHLIWECYVRWEGELWRVLYSEKHRDALSVHRNPFREAFDAPPYEPQRIMRKPGYLFGHSIPQLLEAIQKLMDNAENARISYNQFAIAPIIQADATNPYIRKLDDNGVAPGMIIRTPGPPNMAGIQALQLPKPDLTIEEMELAQRFAEQATFNDFQIAGDPFAAGRRTATEVRTSFNIGTLKLRRMLGDLRVDMARAAKKRWALIELFKVRPAGVTPVYREGKQFLISSDGVTVEEIREAFMQFAAMEGLDPAQLVQEVQDPSLFLNEYQLGPNNQIPGMKRDDIRWMPNGSDVIPDKVAELQKMDGFAPYMGWLEAAQMDERIWYFLKVRLLLMNRYDWKKFIGENPRVRMEREAFMELMQQLTSQSAQTANNGSQALMQGTR